MNGKDIGPWGRRHLIPVYTETPTVRFYQNDSSTLRRRINIVNCFDFDIHFKVDHNSQMITVDTMRITKIESGGHVDIHVRPTNSMKRRLNNKSEVRLRVYHVYKGQFELIGSKTIPCTYLPREPLLDTDQSDDKGDPSFFDYSKPVDGRTVKEKKARQRYYSGRRFYFSRLERYDVPIMCLCVVLMIGLYFLPIAWDSELLYENIYYIMIPIVGELFLIMMISYFERGSCQI